MDSEEEEKEKEKERMKLMLSDKKQKVLGFGQKFKQLGGTNVVIAYFGLYDTLCCYFSDL